MATGILVGLGEIIVGALAGASLYNDEAPMAAAKA
jgi:hypothetical protein